MKKGLLILSILLVGLQASANPVMEALVERAIKQMLKVSTRGEVSEEVLTQVSRRLVPKVSSNIRRLPMRQGAACLENALGEGSLATLIRTTQNIPEKELLLALLERSPYEYRTARKVISGMFLESWQQQEAITQNIFSRIWFKAKSLRTGGKQLNKQRMLELFLEKGHNPQAWANEVRHKVAQKVALQPEEYVAFSSLLNPLNDFYLAEAVETLFFRKAFVLEFWKKRPQEVLYFYDKIRGVVLPHVTSETLPTVLADFPTAIFRATSADRRSAMFWNGLSGKYTQDKISHWATEGYLRLLNMKAMEEVLLEQGQTLRAFLTNTLERLQSQKLSKRLTQRGIIKEVKAQIDLLDRYQGVFKGTSFDLTSSLLRLEDFVEEETLKSLRSSKKFIWWAKNSAFFLITSLLMAKQYVYEPPLDEVIVPADEFYVNEVDIISDIDLKIHFTRLKLSSEKNADDVLRLKAYLEKLKQKRNMLSQ